jgi:glutamyl-tRNA reductase
LNEFDIIISATSSENYILEFSDINDAVKKRGGMPIVIMDIAIPRDIDPKVKKLDSVFYHDMDSLKIIVDQNLNKRKSEIPLVEKIIMEEMISFFGWYNSLGIVPTIKSLRDFFDEIKTDELDKLKNKINPEDYQKVEDMTRRMLGRILHNPTKKLREIAESGTNVQEITTNTILLSELFNLNKSENNRDGSS